MKCPLQVKGGSTVFVFATGSCRNMEKALECKAGDKGTACSIAMAVPVYEGVAWIVTYACVVEQPLTAVRVFQASKLVAIPDGQNFR